MSDTDKFNAGARGEKYVVWKPGVDRHEIVPVPRNFQGHQISPVMRQPFADLPNEGRPSVLPTSKALMPSSEFVPITRTTEGLWVPAKRIVPIVHSTMLSEVETALFPSWYHGLTDNTYIIIHYAPLSSDQVGKLHFGKPSQENVIDVYFSDLSPSTEKVIMISNFDAAERPNKNIFIHPQWIKTLLADGFKYVTLAMNTGSSLRVGRVIICLNGITILDHDYANRPVTPESPLVLDGELGEFKRDRIRAKMVFDQWGFFPLPTVLDLAAGELGNGWSPGYYTIWRWDKDYPDAWCQEFTCWVMCHAGVTWFTPANSRNYLGHWFVENGKWIDPSNTPYEQLPEVVRPGAFVEMKYWKNIKENDHSYKGFGHSTFFIGWDGDFDPNGKNYFWCIGGNQSNTAENGSNGRGLGWGQVTIWRFCIGQDLSDDDLDIKWDASQWWAFNPSNPNDQHYLDGFGNTDDIC